MSKRKGRPADREQEAEGQSAPKPPPYEAPPDLPPPDPPQPNVPFLVVAGVLYAGWVAFLYWMATTG